MEIRKLIEQICSQDGFNRLLSKIDSGERVINLKQISGSFGAFLAAGMIRRKKGIHLFIFNNSDKAAFFYSDLFKLLHHSNDNKSGNNVSSDDVLFFPSSFKRSSRYGQEDVSHIVQRTQVIDRIKANPELFAIVTYPEAIAEFAPLDSSLIQRTLTLKIGDIIHREALVETFEDYGFKRCDFVYEPGTYALRGYIVDVFSFSLNMPYRLVFSNNTINMIRCFDISSQISDTELQEAVITANIRTITKKNGIPFLDFIPDTTTVWTEDRNATANIIDALNENKYFRQNDGKQVAAPEMINGKMFQESLKRLLNIQLNSSMSKNSIKFNTEPQPIFNKKFDLLANDIIDKTKAGYTVLIIAENLNQIERLQTIFNSLPNKNVKFSSVNTSISEGFIDLKTKTCCYTDHQVFQRYHRYKIRGEVKKNNEITIQELTGLNVGDYIVHTNHGIGIFGGLIQLDINGKTQEVIMLRYKDDDRIFVNLQNLHKISKYRGQDGIKPTIHKIGSDVWSKLKLTAKKKIKDIASDLIILYAKRKETQGFAFSPDSFLQHELESSFIYEDTPDQNRTTKEVKEDMERSYPMDRLVCGDVGFGKTEIAIRAAFKAVTDNKQVVVLVPTTILALQHYKSFQSRLTNFPVNIDYISRMKSPNEIKISLEKLRQGKTNIIIGTHRLLTQDVMFKDLGLLIIDEEQRFGVVAKEKIRRNKVNIDTLTLSATPIPRTLQFSLLGARDLSIISTPPPNRVPITTEIHIFSEVVIKDAIDLEIQRGGQIFFIHNRIKDIMEIEQIINRIHPIARTVVAHGQMDGSKLEEIMTDFIDGQYDILIATTIIESGLDIPNANTIIINQAQNFGLSELHQLRGRVGRSNRKAFCYLIAPPDLVQSPNARRRLNAIEGFSELGSGFNIAMQDLDIRGAGNLLGGEQSGFITEIGFEAYQKILNEAMMELRKEHPFEDLSGLSGTMYISDFQFDSDIDANLPDQYVSNKPEKLRLYRELDNIETDIQLDAFKERLIDRFGNIPKETEELLQIVTLRRYATQLGFERAIIKNERMSLFFPLNSQSPYYSSPTFFNILNHIQKQPTKFAMKERNFKLLLYVNNIQSHKDAVGILYDMLADNITPNKSQ
jgi:transcription-repair coupling factor (superfamily II helicase)